MNTTGSSTGWNGSLDSLPDDTLISISLGELRKLGRPIDGTRELMAMIGETEKHVLVRYDPLRKYNKKYFTVVIDDPYLKEGHPNKTWRMDTENPVVAFWAYIDKQIGEE